jgi:hypothetical protein
MRLKIIKLTEALVRVKEQTEALLYSEAENIDNETYKRLLDVHSEICRALDKLL